MIFGTFENPVEFSGEVGFFEGSSKRMGALLTGRQIA